MNFSKTQKKLLNLLKKNINEDILHYNQAFLLLTGGRTIQKFLPEIAKLDLPWGKIYISLSDERLVSKKNSNSNEFMLKEKFLKLDGPNNAKYISLKDTYHLSKEKGSFKNIFPSISFSLLSSGLDGHLASLFPDDQENLGNISPILLIERSDFQRITFSLDFLLQAKRTAILIDGKKKYESYIKITKSDSLLKMLYKNSIILNFTDNQKIATRTEI